MIKLKIQSSTAYLIRYNLIMIGCELTYLELWPLSAESFNWH